MHPTPISAIKSYHAHIYFRDAAGALDRGGFAENIGERFWVQMGRWHDKLVGPHARPMYQVAFTVEVFASFVPWLMLNRSGLTVLVHPNSGNPRNDHLIHAFWMGEMLPIVRPDQVPGS